MNFFPSFGKKVKGWLGIESVKGGGVRWISRMILLEAVDCMCCICISGWEPNS